MAPLGPPASADVSSTPRSAADFDDLRDPAACTVRYSRLDREPGLRVYPNLGVFDEPVVAALLGCDPERLRQIRSALNSVLNLACDELFAEPGFESLFVPSPSLLRCRGGRRRLHHGRRPLLDGTARPSPSSSRPGGTSCNQCGHQQYYYVGFDRQLRIHRLEKPEPCDRHDRDKRRQAPRSGAKARMASPSERLETSGCT